MSSLTNEALERSLDLLRQASSPRGYVASPDFDHYAQVWARDAAISALGALASRDDDLIDGVVRTVESMAATMSPLGHVAAVIHMDGDTWDWADGGVVDATAWYVILAGALLATTDDAQIAETHWTSVSRAMNWLRHQDVTGSGLISAAPSTDWMDSSVVRSGRTLNLNALYQWAAAASEAVAHAVGSEAPCDADDLAWRVNALFWPTEEIGPEALMMHMERRPEVFPHSASVRAHAEASGRARGHYISHIIHSHYDESCDVLANTILVCSGVADADRAVTILDHLDDRGVGQPYPSRVWDDPVSRTTPTSMFVPGVERHLDERWHNPPYAYHNGGIWPYVGGFHTTALALAGRFDAAADMLGRLAEANQLGSWGFHEWIHGKTGEPDGAPAQTWNAGAYVLAERAIRDPESVAKLFFRPNT